ncbi:MAG: class I SAM-dependent rRNA methyltransferase [Flavobacteriales bacterium]|nr:class I SAM-dependent rRNA methyltransferase [Flavobacteriales bacterium]MCB9166489.1 class I SAM-dependent rRNA methyltransferase [Flavobacteriales bacterium]
MARLIIQDTHDRVRKGHPWVFDNQVLRVDGSARPGDAVQVFDAERGPIGQALYNPRSRIIARMIERSLDRAIDEDFLRERLIAAWTHRQRYGYDRSARMVFGEADGLPGLVVDKFDDVLVIQTLALGMDRMKPGIVTILNEIFQPRGIYERNDVPVREKEGLEQVRGALSGPFETTLLVEENWPPGAGNGVRFAVDVAKGQKTGHFLDQVANHAAIRPFCDGARVLDLFTHTGGFALHAAKYGAAEVLGVDISEEACSQARTNATINGLEDRCSFRTENVFDFLTAASRRGMQWDMIVLDPPAFAKSRAALDKAQRGYKEIALRAMKCLPPGGTLVTCSCSQHMTPELFRRTTEAAANDAHRQLREVYHGTQPPDHPVLWSFPESLYLKCYMLQAL